jgi:hypothetical protein
MARLINAHTSSPRFVAPPRSLASPILASRRNERDRTIKFLVYLRIVACDPCICTKYRRTGVAQSKPAGLCKPAGRIQYQVA